MRNLTELIKNDSTLLSCLTWHDLPVNVSITGITQHSSRCSKDFLFVAVSGATSSSKDGHDFIDDAIANGASVVVVAHKFNPQKTYQCLLIKAHDTKRALCHLVEAWHDYPSRHLKVIGITGTNGKTSTSFMLHSIFAEAGFSPRIMGTLGVGNPASLEKSSHTTLEPEVSSSLLAKFQKDGATHVIMEVSSHALSLKRCEAIQFHAVGLTNITPDHLDLHGTMDNYRRAKARLFTECSNNETKICLPIHHQLGTIDRAAISYGPSPADIAFSDVKVIQGKTQFKLHDGGHTITISLPFLGNFHVHNATLAASIARACGISLEDIAHGLSHTPQIPGRLERVECGQDFLVFVDFAHTPDGLYSVLSTLKNLKSQKIILVFGCGGDRDQSKRPLMGSIAEKLADIVIITDDNPRGENPEHIRSQIRAGMKSMSVIEIANREEAIRHALKTAQEGDIVLVAGKGHETHQIYGDLKFDFSDVLVAKKFLRAL